MSLRQQAYEQVKEKIVSLELAPGSVIDETALQAELGLGRTPIREGLQRLALEKLVTIVPRRGTFVTNVRSRDIRWLFEVRLVLESLGAQLAAERGSEENWRQMEAVLEDLGEKEEPVDNESLIAVDEACHEIIYEAADNKFLRDILSTLYALSLRLWYLYLPKIGDVQGAVLEHRSILEALRSRDGARASELVKRHIRAFQDEFRSVALDLHPMDKSVSSR